MEFFEMKKIQQDYFKEITKDATHLFEVDVDKDELWNVYLDSFPVGSNDIFRERREHDCSCCRHFIKSFGNVVVIKDNQITTIWDVSLGDGVYQPVFNAMSKYIKSKSVSDVYVSKLKEIGTNKNIERLGNNDFLEWEHFYIELPNKFVDRSERSIGDIQGSLRDTRNVFKRSLDEITIDSLDAILDLISQKSLHRGEEWEKALTEFRKYKFEYENLKTKKEKEIYTWEKSVVVGEVIGRIRNHSMGTLLTNVSNNIDLDTAVYKYEKIVAGENYKRSSPIITQRQLDDGIKALEKDGYIDSIGGRYARLDDINVNDILFTNKDSAKKIGGSNIFDEMSKDIPLNVKKYSRTEEISIDDFVKNVLPTAKEIEILFENKHTSNLVSLIAPEIKDSKNMFKWDNRFRWAYTGNITDSAMKEKVKFAGGNVTGDLCCRLAWYNFDDLDLHMIEPSGDEIYYSTFTKRRGNFSSCGGQLDVDMNAGGGSTREPVENIYYGNKNKMKEGIYTLYVNQFSRRENIDIGFEVEIDFMGEVMHFSYDKRVDGDVVVAKFSYSHNDGIRIINSLPSKYNSVSKEVWGLKTNSFVPVSVIMYSPNYWNKQHGIGNRHYFFMMKDCINSEQPNSFYNEFLKEDLMKHRRFLEVLGSKKKIENSDEQLSGLGFCSTKRNDVVVKVKGNVERLLKIKF